MTHAIKPSVGKYGRRAPKNHPAIALSAVLKADFAGITIPASENYGLEFSELKMLGNDVAGDCVAVTWANFRALITTVLAGKTDYPSQEWVWEMYKTQNPNFDPNGSSETNGPGSPEDNGMDIQTFLELLVHEGGPDGVKLLAFAKVDYLNATELKTALAVFGVVWIGTYVQTQNETAFHNGKVWTYAANGKSAGGHSVPAVGYSADGLYDFYTWAQETQFDESFRTKLVEEAWVCIWPENLTSKQFIEGIDLAKLASEYSAITHGRVFPVVPPIPTPAPVPAPTPEPIPAPVIQPPVPSPVIEPPVVSHDILIANQNLALAIPTGWTMRNHVGDTRKAAHALAVWANATGHTFAATATDEDQS